MVPQGYSELEAQVPHRRSFAVNRKSRLLVVPRLSLRSTRGRQLRGDGGGIGRTTRASRRNHEAVGRWRTHYSSASTLAAARALMRETRPRSRHRRVRELRYVM